MELWHESAGKGETILLIHAGICDARMWERQMTTLAPAGRVVRCDLRGFGRTPSDAVDYADAADLAELIEGEGFGPAILVGASMGGAAALDLTLARPDLVSALVLVSASHPDQEWSAEIERFERREAELFEAGDIDGVVELNLRVWLDRPGRSSDQADPELRVLVGEMQRRAAELQLVHPGARCGQLVSDQAARLGEVSVPTLALVGDLDLPELLASTPRLAADIPGAEAATIAGASHLPSMEQPEAFDRIVLDFLAGLQD